MPEARAPVLYIDTGQKAKENVALLRTLEHTPIAVDSEFDRDGSLVLVSYSRGKGRVVVRGDVFLDYYKEILENPKMEFVYQNAKADLSTFYGYGIDADKSFSSDTLIMGWLLDENDLHHDLKHMCHRYLGWYRRGYADLFSYIPFAKRQSKAKTPPKKIVVEPSHFITGTLPDEMIWDVLSETERSTGITEELVSTAKKRWFDTMINYSGDDAQSTILLYWYIRRQLEQEGYWERYLSLDKPFTTTLMRCGERGIQLDTSKLTKYLQKVAVSEARFTHSFQAMANKPGINLRSTTQLKELFFNELGWEVRADFISAKGNESLSESVLQWYVEEHQAPLAKLLLGFREMASLRGTFLEGLLSGVEEDSRLYSDFIQHKANTGRIASRKYIEEVEVEKVRVLKSGKEKVTKKILKIKKGANIQKGCCKSS